MPTTAPPPQNISFITCVVLIYAPLTALMCINMACDQHSRAQEQMRGGKMLMRKKENRPNNFFSVASAVKSATVRMAIVSTQHRMANIRWFTFGTKFFNMPTAKG